MPTDERRHGGSSSREVSPNARSMSRTSRASRASLTSRASSRERGVGDARYASNIISTAQRKWGGAPVVPVAPVAPTAPTNTNSRASSVASAKEDPLREEFVALLKEIIQEPPTEPIRKRSAPPSATVGPTVVRQHGEGKGEVKGERKRRCSSLPNRERKRTPSPICFTHRSELAESCKSECFDDVFYT